MNSPTPSLIRIAKLLSFERCRRKEQLCEDNLVAKCTHQIFEYDESDEEEEEEEDLKLSEMDEGEHRAHRPRQQRLPQDGRSATPLHRRPVGSALIGGREAAVGRKHTHKPQRRRIVQKLASSFLCSREIHVSAMGEVFLLGNL